jgi:ankyrin repeat protein
MNYVNTTPLSIATLKGYKDIIIELLNRNANINTETILKRSPLHHAIVHNNKDIVTILLNHNANIMTIDENNDTPLHYASQTGNKDIIVELLEHNACIKTKNKFNKTPYDLAIFKNHNYEIVELLKINKFIEDNVIIENDISYTNSLVKRITCSVCFTNERKVVFSCGHSTCYDCSESITECCECKVLINKKFTMYF